jgi:hypothetical protein
MKFSRLAAFCAVAAWLVRLSPLAQEVDGITAATENNKCTFILPIETTATSAVIKWTEAHSGGMGVFCYGKSVADNCRNVTAVERIAKTIELTGLESGTTYHVRVEFTKPGEVPYAATGTFTAKDPAAVGGSRRHETKRETYVVGGSGILAPGTPQPGDVFAVMDLQGALVGEIDVGSDSTRSLSRLSEGIFVVILRRDGTAIGARTLHIRKGAP